MVSWIICLVYIFYSFKKKNSNLEFKVKKCLNKMAMPSSFIVPLTGFLMIIEDPSEMKNLYFYAKFTLAVFGFLAMLQLRSWVEFDIFDKNKIKIRRLNLLILINLFLINLIVYYK
tara:strand:+ start:200 stop:547 length:348 start_codon:yes stop_codon:yes gene_type:complete